jgi:hypothetical protein
MALRNFFWCLKGCGKSVEFYSESGRRLLENKNYLCKRCKSRFTKQELKELNGDLKPTPNEKKLLQL